jgi:hypothetical protein
MIRGEEPTQTYNRLKDPHQQDKELQKHAMD